MDPRERLLRVYKELADSYERSGQPPMRDRFLVLAADAALTAGQDAEAERLRQRLLQLNPHHLLKPYASFAQAAQAPDVQTYLRDLRKNYPLDVSQMLLNKVRSGGAAAARPAAPALPPTAPVIDLDDDGTLALGGEPEPLKVFQVRDDTDLGQTAALPPQAAPRRPPTSSAPTEATPRPVPVPRSAPAARPPAPPVRKPAPSSSVPAAARSRPAPARTLPPAPANPLVPETEGEGGGWLGLVLFVLVLLGGLACAAYTFGRPFLSGW
jgi:hypothetical protein